jgi:hypothetical protein
LPEESPAVECPSISASNRSTGPPGTNWVTTKVTSITPKRVGIISSIRLKIYAAIDTIKNLEFRIKN